MKEQESKYANIEECFILSKIPPGISWSFYSHKFKAYLDRFKWFNAFDEDLAVYLSEFASELEFQTALT
ncbi:hypothetical protein [Candidatus Lokiarchaeum ossiferum]|uniref:hypothetical protein n=1 Tax=Candidatus Lokiarchaeum ossiferum TaxID=2951803 RepID=UPI00352BDD96